MPGSLTVLLLPMVTGGPSLSLPGSSTGVGGAVGAVESSVPVG